MSANDPSNHVTAIEKALTDIEIVRKYFHKDNVNEWDDVGNTPLILLIIHNDETIHLPEDLHKLWENKREIIRFFFQIGAKVTVTSKCGVTPLQHFLRYFHESVCQVCIKTNKGRLDDDLLDDWRMMICLLTEHGADINAINEEGITPLWYFIYKFLEFKHEDLILHYLSEVIKLLVGSFNADFHRTDRKDRSPLEFTLHKLIENEAEEQTVFTYYLQRIVKYLAECTAIRSKTTVDAVLRRHNLTEKWKKCRSVQ
ncbi:unnamed protein product, partial [Owenia fusiformis]